MGYFKNVSRLLFVALMLTLIPGKCFAIDKYSDFKDYIVPITSLTIPDNTTIVGVGEATHGNKEFVQIKLEVFKQLVKNYGFKVFALEGDFGGCQVVNDYVVNGKGTAEDAVKQIGFAIYNTQEMVDLVEWIHDYNMTVSENNKIHFYGFDMQRYDNNKKELLTYFQKVDGSKTELYSKNLLDLNDETVYNQSKDKIQTGLTSIENIISDMDRNKEQYILKSSQVEFDLAYEYAKCIKENATLQSDGSNYSNVRDKFMADKVQWIVSYEKELGNNKICITGHNGHIEKSSASSYKSMGNILADIYKKQYYAIGTDFGESTFNCRDIVTGERKEFSLKNNDTNKLITLFGNTGYEQGLLDISKADENPEYKELLASTIKMSNIGDEFCELYKLSPKYYTLNMVPSNAYDGIIFVKHATPTKMLD